MIDIYADASASEHDSPYSLSHGELAVNVGAYEQSTLTWFGGWVGCIPRIIAEFGRLFLLRYPENQRG